MLTSQPTPSPLNEQAVPLELLQELLIAVSCKAISLEHANLVLLSWLQMELPDEPMALLALRTWLFGATPEVLH